MKALKVILGKGERMRRGPNFIERDVFEHVMRKILRKDGKNFEDVDTIYGDMSRLVVAWVACSNPRKLKDLYNELGWGGDANVRAIHEAAKAWLEEYHPGRCPVIEE
jgi:hypothetical protein